MSRYSRRRALLRKYITTEDMDEDIKHEDIEESSFYFKELKGMELCQIDSKNDGETLLLKEKKKL